MGRFSFSKSHKKLGGTPAAPKSSALAVVPQSAVLAVVPQPIVHQDWPDDDEILLEFGDKSSNCNHWCLKDAFEGVQVFGGTGSGKTSGSGKALAKAFIEFNFGGLVLTAKRDEAEMWAEYMKKAGRQDDLVIFPRYRNGKPESLQFNFLRYAFESEKGGVGKTENLVNLFCSVLEVAERKSGGGGSNEGYWQRATKQLLRNAIDLCILATGSVNLESLHEIVYTAPQTLEAAAVWVTPSTTKRASSSLLAISSALPYPWKNSQYRTTSLPIPPKTGRLMSLMLSSF